MREKERMRERERERERERGREDQKTIFNKNVSVKERWREKGSLESLRLDSRFSIQTKEGTLACLTIGDLGF